MRADCVTDEAIAVGIQRLVATLDEKQRRRVVGLLAAERGRGGVRALAALTGLSPNTIVKGRRELLRDRDPHPDRVRAPGGGRKPAPKKIPG